MSLLDLIDHPARLSQAEADRIELESIPFDLWQVLEGVAVLVQVPADAEGIDLAENDLGALLPQAAAADAAARGAGALGEDRADDRLTATGRVTIARRRRRAARPAPDRA